MRNDRIMIAKLQIENDNKFSSVAEPKCYTGFIFKLLRARWLHVIRDFFISFSLKALIIITITTNTSITISIVSSSFSKESCSIILRRTISAFYPVKNITLRPSWPECDISVLSYCNQCPQTDSQVRSGRWSARPLLLYNVLGKTGNFLW